VAAYEDQLGFWGESSARQGKPSQPAAAAPPGPPAQPPASTATVPVSTPAVFPGESGRLSRRGYDPTGPLATVPGVPPELAPPVRPLTAEEMARPPIDYYREVWAALWWPLRCAWSTAAARVVPVWIGGALVFLAVVATYSVLFAGIVYPMAALWVLFAFGSVFRVVCQIVTSTAGGAAEPPVGVGEGFLKTLRSGLVGVGILLLPLLPIAGLWYSGQLSQPAAVVAGGLSAAAVLFLQPRMVIGWAFRQARGRQDPRVRLRGRGGESLMLWLVLLAIRALYGGGAVGLVFVALRCFWRIEVWQVFALGVVAACSAPLVFLLGLFGEARAMGLLAMHVRLGGDDDLP
jgi:hypothetical protein